MSDSIHRSIHQERESFFTIHSSQLSTRSLPAVFAILRFLPQYDWIFWHDADSIFLNFSRPLNEYLDPKYDMVLTAAPCSSSDGGDAAWGEGPSVLDTGHMLVQNTKTALNTFRSVWGMWNHSHCKYGNTAADVAAADAALLDPQSAAAAGGAGGGGGGKPKQPLCRPGVGSSMVEPTADGKHRTPPKSVPNKAQYRGGDQGALMAVLSNCEVCASKVKYTGFRAFNSLWPCQGEGDLVVVSDFASTAQQNEFA